MAGPEDDNGKTKNRRAASKRGRHKRSHAPKINPNVDIENWRQKLRRRSVKFDDDQKVVFLRAFATHGMKMRACDEADVSLQTVNNHIENDPEFGNMVDEALQSYRDTLAEEVTRRGRDGYLEGVYNKDGRVFEHWHDEDGNPIYRHRETGKAVYFPDYRDMSAEERKALLEPLYGPAWTRKFSDGLLTLEIRRVDSTYREKQTVDLNHGGGVMVAPAEQSVEDWVKEQQEKNAARLPPPGAEED